MPTNGSADWADTESFGLADSVISFASLALAIELIWIVSAEARPISDVFVRKIVFGVYVLSVLMTTILFGILAGKYDIAAHLASGGNCALGVNACNMMSITLGLAATTWTGLGIFVFYLYTRPASVAGLLLPASEELPKKRKGGSTTRRG